GVSGGGRSARQLRARLHRLGPGLGAPLRRARPPGGGGRHQKPGRRAHRGPSDYVAWQRDNKVCFIRMEWRGFGHVPMNLELRLSVEDSPNSAGVAIDAIRCAKLGLDRGIGGPLEAVSAFAMKHPPRQMRDSEAREALERFILGG